MIQELLGGTPMDQHHHHQQIKSATNAMAHHHVSSLPMVLQPISANPSPTSSSTSSRSSTQRSPSATSSPQGQGQQQGPEQAPLRCPRCNSSNTKFCYYNNYNLTQPRHFCKTCRRYWTKGGALRNVPIGGGCRKPRPMPAPVAKQSTVVPAASCKSALSGTGIGMAPPPLGLGVGPAMSSWAPQQLMALLNSTRAMQGLHHGGQGHGHGGGGNNVHRLLGLDTMGQLQVLPGHSPNNAMWPPVAHRPMPPPPPMHLDMAGPLGLGLGGHSDLFSNLGLKPPSSSSLAPAASYYNDQLNAVVSNGGGGAGRPNAYESPSSYSCATTMASLPAASSTVSSGLTVGMDQQQPPVSTSSSLAAQEMQYWNSGPAAMSMAAWPDLPALNGAFP
ncbi:dof zinc finger protein DOF3.2 [Brachypodium distachyon]|uniref:Dof zinc finger protein n=1 Tax=Brachypodium distachyon TaxID=15368 RepID=I1GMY8_BRADI|nr:dof zinc finger protein DOF3.2 [Brachypodium distachyon]KQK13036.1 hypothetical protein BRADI_1g07600v3 [Brachypodium distachyon]|eukprot:XP_003559395.1 dof zinc finger protein DOF3.2 [Brachypodium distachyon]